MRLILLPGMDGTGVLFKPLLEILQPPFVASVIDYPRDKKLGYTELTELVRARLPNDGSPYWIVAESFSGPIALQLGGQPLEGLSGIVLVASFLTPPVPAWLRFFIGSMFFACPPPQQALKIFLLGSDADQNLVQVVRETIASVRPDVLAFRIREILSCHVESQFRACLVPMLFIEALEDRLVSSSRDRLNELRSDVQILQIEGPHLIIQKQPQQVLDEVSKMIFKT